MKSGGSMAKRIVVAVAIAVVALVAVFAWYVGDYYHADDIALETVADADGANDGVTVQKLGTGAIAFVPEQPSAGFVFYPGAKVQPESYAPLLAECARENVLCVLLKPRFNLAILDVDAAEGVQGQFPDVDTWAIGGHSVGGVAAADYLARHEGDFEAIVFLASYPAVDLSTFGGSALSVTGTEDGALNRDKYEKAKDLLPENRREIQISGGNHAYYGNYGEQSGDGQATISREDQQSQTVRAIVELFK